MKSLFVFLLLLDIPQLNGGQRIEEFGQILLRLAFPSFHNSSIKYCCKFHPGGCYPLLESTGYVFDYLRERVTQTQGDGWIEFKISKAHIEDSGYYRCGVSADNRIYRDYNVEVYEASIPNNESKPPPTTTTVKAPDTFRTTPDSTEPDLAVEHGDSPTGPSSFIVPVAAIGSIIVMIIFSSAIAAVCFRVKAKRKQLDKNGETRCESFKQENTETGTIVYTTVDFQAQPKPAELYANLRRHETQAEAPDSTSTEPDGMVVYSKLAIHQ